MCYSQYTHEIRDYDTLLDIADDEEAMNVTDITEIPPLLSVADFDTLYEDEFYPIHEHDATNAPPHIEDSALLTIDEVASITEDGLTRMDELLALIANPRGMSHAHELSWSTLAYFLTLTSDSNEDYSILSLPNNVTTTPCDSIVLYASRKFVSLHDLSIAMFQVMRLWRACDVACTLVHSCFQGVLETELRCCSYWFGQARARTTVTI